MRKRSLTQTIGKIELLFIESNVPCSNEKFAFVQLRYVLFRSDERLCQGNDLFNEQNQVKYVQRTFVYLCVD